MPNRTARKTNGLSNALEKARELAAAAEAKELDETGLEGAAQDVGAIFSRMFDVAPLQAGELSIREKRELATVLAEQARRAKESLKLYRDTPEQNAFHASMARLRVIRGSNRAGKTLAACVEIARAVMGQDPYNKWKKKGRFIVVGKDLLHCSKVIYRKLYKPGAFQVIRDLETEEWRTFDPRTDRGRESQSEDAPPLIPYRAYGPGAISWENKKEEIARTIVHKNGWELTFFSGEGEPPQGWDVDGVLFDEEIPNSQWLKEMKARIVDRRGRFVWSATPQVGCGELIDLSEQAYREMGTENPRVTEHFLTIDMNPYLGDEVKENFKADFADDEDEYNVRILGEFATSGMRVYPEFSTRGVHREESFAIPDDWCRSVAIDPGRQVAAALFIAVPPPHSVYDRPIVYDEVYFKKANAKLFAAAIKAKVGNHFIQRWLIDSHEGRKHETASGRCIEEQYAEEFRKCGMKNNGFTGFMWASDDVDAGINAAKTKLFIEEGAPAWKFFCEKLPMFCWEISRYVNKRITRGGHVVDLTSRSNLHNHLMDCFRYLAMCNQRYIRPPIKGVKKGYTNVAMDAKRKKKREQSGWGNSVRL